MTKKQTKLIKDPTTKKQRKERSRLLDEQNKLNYICLTGKAYDDYIDYVKNSGHIKEVTEEKILENKAVESRVKAHSNDWEVIEEIKELSFNDKYKKDRITTLYLNQAELGLKQSEIIKTVNKLVAFINNYKQLLP
jgi:hypothetical protein